MSVPTGVAAAVAATILFWGSALAAQPVLLQSSDGDRIAAALRCSQAATSNSAFTKAAWTTMSSPAIASTCPFLIIAAVS